MKRFGGKVVLVTGGARNTGLEIVDPKDVDAMMDVIEKDCGDRP